MHPMPHWLPYPPSSFGLDPPAAGFGAPSLDNGLDIVFDVGSATLLFNITQDTFTKIDAGSADGWPSDGHPIISGDGRFVVYTKERESGTVYPVFYAPMFYVVDRTTGQKMKIDLLTHLAGVFNFSPYAGANYAWPLAMSIDNGKLLYKPYYPDPRVYMYDFPTGKSQRICTK